MPPTLVVMCGLPGSGKTRLAEKLRLFEYPEALILSSDDIRWTFSGSTSARYKPWADRYVWEVIEGFARGCLAYGRDVILDSTALTVEKRAEYIYWAFAIGALCVGHYIQVDERESARRSARHIPEGDIKQLASQLEPPTKDEGFAGLFVHVDDEANTGTFSAWEDLCNEGE